MATSLKLGASFGHGDHSLAPSEAGRLELERARQQLHPTPATLLERRVGLRAVTRDRIHFRPTPTTAAVLCVHRLGGPRSVVRDIMHGYSPNT